VIARVWAILVILFISTSTGIVVSTTASRVHPVMKNPTNIHHRIIVTANTTTAVIITAKTMSSNPGLQIAAENVIRGTQGAVTLVGAGTTAARTGSVDKMMILGHASAKGIVISKCLDEYWAPQAI
jgi:hypothetical protein